MSVLLFCSIDTIIRIEDDDKKLYDCRYCVFRDVISMLVCPFVIKREIETLK